MPRRGALTLIVFVIAVVSATAFAWYTRNVWEDFYITYRVSKNLVEGHGLVFQLGERVHTFTSPLGVLLPAATLWVGGGHSDEFALRAFQALSAIVFAGAVVLLVRMCRQTWKFPMAACLLIAAFLVLDAKAVDFSMNGMETAFMLLFLVVFLSAITRGVDRGWMGIGLAAAALQWTRPDAFLLGLAVVVGFWFFCPESLSERGRLQALRPLVKSLLVAAALYLPWVVFAWYYYGSPIPNTVLAKSQSLTFWNFASLKAWLMTPWIAGLGTAPLPIYPHMGGWPNWAVLVGYHSACLLGHWWLLPWADRRGRAVSFAAFFFGLYLTQINLYPWYLPPASVLLILTLGFALWDVTRWTASFGRWAVVVPISVATVLLVLQAGLFVGTAWQLKNQERIIEGQRAEIGRQLKAKAGPNDRVFLECVGYIGFNSGLKIMDYPGLTAPEVVRFRKEKADDWGAIVRHFKPEWLVLRPHELPRVNSTLYPEFQREYYVAGIFSQEKEIDKLQPMLGTPYLRYDQIFYVLHRQ